MASYLRNSAVAAPTQIESAYIDSRSPGYAGRVVRYNEEQDQLPIYNDKDNKLDSCSGRQIMKHILPLSQKKNINGTQITSSEIAKFNLSEHSGMLIDKTTIRTSLGRKTGNSYSEVDTRNVLETLKEISRKRILSEETCIENEDKRSLDNWNDGTVPKKKARLNFSQTMDKIPFNKMYAIDELTASHTSMDQQPRDHRQNNQYDGTINPFSEESIEVKLIDVETQTPYETQLSKAPVTVLKNTYKEKLLINKEYKIRKLSPVKVFDEIPLEAMRKNRLTILMGSFMKRKLSSQQHYETPETSVQHQDMPKPLTSILTKSAKSTVKTTKHVTFNLSHTTATMDSPNTCIKLPLSITSKGHSLTKFHGNDTVTKTSTALVTPIVSSNIVESSTLRTLQAKDGNNNDFSPNTLLSQSKSQNQSKTVATVSSSFSLPVLTTSNSKFNTPCLHIIPKNIDLPGSENVKTVDAFQTSPGIVNSSVPQNSISSSSLPIYTSSLTLANVCQVSTFSKNNLVSPFTLTLTASNDINSNTTPSFANASTIVPTLSVSSSLHNTETKNLNPSLAFALTTFVSSAFTDTNTSVYNSDIVLPAFTHLTTTPVSVAVSNSFGRTNASTITCSSSNLFMNTNNSMSSPLTSSRNNNSTSIFESNSSFGQATTTSVLNSTKDVITTGNSLFPPFSTKTSSMGKSSYGLNSLQHTSSTTGSGLFSTLSASPSNVFNFSGNDNKSTNFTFEASKSNQQFFNFKNDNFDVTNRNVGIKFNSITPFNIQSGPTSMFNIGSGSTAPNRSRSQLKGKRRT